MFNRTVNIRYLSQVVECKSTGLFERPSQILLPIGYPAGGKVPNTDRDYTDGNISYIPAILIYIPINVSSFRS